MFSVYESPSTATTLAQQRSPVAKVLHFLLPFIASCVGSMEQPVRLRFSQLVRHSNVDSKKKQGMMIKFAENIAEFAASSGKKDVIVLSSLDFQRLHNLDLSR